ncbi:RNA polymerase subunit sigma-70 [Nakamurella sp.]|uniref:RNA polymerase subunit sigma-70 n=1 Tax=Nakamurella sp. TaxID=1869182 RepID=UPI003783C9CC
MTVTDLDRLAELEALRRPLTAYAYRMLGASSESDDAAQETILRAHRHLDRFDPGRGSLRTWVFRIATNVCLDLLRGVARRALAVDLGPASVDGSLGAPLPADRFVEPMPGARLLSATDPADLVVERESVRLAFVAALQHLAPRQRATLILRDVLHFSAAETAALLDTSAAAVNSALQRARETLDRHRPSPTDPFEPADPAQRELLDRYVAAFEAHDVDALTAVLRDDATTSMPPFAWWIQGGARIAGLVAAGGCAGARLVPTDICGSPGFGQYRPDDDGVLRPFALVLVQPRAGRIGDSVTFLGSGSRFAEFELPEFLPPDR